MVPLSSYSICPQLVKMVLLICQSKKPTVSAGNLFFSLEVAEFALRRWKWKANESSYLQVESQSNGQYLQNALSFPPN